MPKNIVKDVAKIAPEWKRATLIRGRLFEFVVPNVLVLIKQR
jgi:hypothetical protein